MVFFVWYSTLNQLPDLLIAALMHVPQFENSWSRLLKLEILEIQYVSCCLFALRFSPLVNEMSKKSASLWESQIYNVGVADTLNFPAMFATPALNFWRE